jgi:hypothetical protein
MKTLSRIIPLACLLSFSGCGHSNNLLLGEVRATVGAHDVTVTDCYRFKVPQPERLADTPSGEPSYVFKPCRDAEILVRGKELWVNGKSYGSIGATDSILVDHGVVSTAQDTAQDSARPRH